MLIGRSMAFHNYQVIHILLSFIGTLFPCSGMNTKCKTWLPNSAQESASSLLPIFIWRRILQKSNDFLLLDFQDSPSRQASYDMEHIYCIVIRGILHWVLKKILSYLSIEHASQVVRVTLVLIKCCKKFNDPWILSVCALFA